MNEDNKDEVVYLYLDDIIPNRFQPREVFDEKALKELAVSIKEHGVIQPIIVRSVNGKYEIIAGERRYKASALAGLTKIPAIIRNLDDKESSKVALLENLQRKNLNPIEEARTYQKILELDQMTQEELAKTMGKSQSAVANKLRLLSLPIDTQDALLKEQISERHARSLLNIEDEKVQKDMLKRVIKEKMTVRQLEEEIKKMYPKDETKENDSTSSLQNVDTLISINPSAVDSLISEPATLPVEEQKPKFINYGEINDEEEDEEDDENTYGLQEKPNSTAPIDINNLKSNTSDISVATKPTADLDSLLNINDSIPNDSQTSEKKNFKFITPAEEIVKTDALKGKEEHIEDYFKTPDLVPVDLPSEVQSPKVNQADLTNALNDEDLIPENKEFTSQQAVQQIRDLMEELKKKNIKVTMDEMNFSNSYQMIIKVEK